MPFGDVSLTVIYLLALFYTLFWLLTLLESGESSKMRVRRFPKVSVVVPSYNEERHLAASVESVLALDYPKDKLELIIVDDGSADSTLEIANELKAKHSGSSITVLTQPNQGKWKALNAGLERASGEFFACLDADSFVNPDTLKNVLPYFGDERVAVVLPLMKVRHPKTFFQRVQWYEYIINMFYKKLIGFLNAIHVAPGPFSLYRAGVLREVGGFRQAHFTEDLEIVLRLQKHHYRIIQVSDAEVYTVSPESLRGVYRQRYRWFRGSILNVWDYRSMLFNPRYGDFGMFQMPVVLFNGAIAVVLVTLTLYFNLLQPLWGKLSSLFLINFDILPLLSSFSFSINVLDLNFYKLFILVFFVFLSLLVVFLAHRLTHENLLRYGIRSLLFFLFFYYITLAAVWVGLFIDILLRREHKW